MPSSRSSASRRVSPCAMSFAISGSYETPISSPSSTPASTRMSAGKAQSVDAPGLGEERSRIFGVQSHFDRVARRPRTGLIARVSPATMRSCCSTRSMPGDELRHRVLDLDAAVELEKPEVASVDHELGRAGAPVADGPGERDRRVAHRGAQLVVEAGERATPRAPSDDDAGSSTPARRARRRRRRASPRSWISTWRGRST